MTTTSSPARDPGRSQPTAEHVKAVLTYARGRTLVVHRTSCFQGRSQGSGDGWRCDEHFDPECSQGAGITARRRKEPDETCEAKPPRYGQRDGDWRVRSAVLHHDVDRPPSDRESTRTSSSHGGRPTPAHDIPHQERGSDEHANHTQHDDRISVPVRGWNDCHAIGSGSRRRALLLRAPPKLGVRRRMSLSAGTDIHPPTHTVSTTYG